MDRLVLYKPSPTRIKLAAYGAEECSLRRVNPSQVRVQCKLPDKTFPAFCARERLLTSVNLLMFKQLPLPLVTLPTLWAGKGPLAIVSVLVLKEGRVCGKAFPALGT